MANVPNFLREFSFRSDERDVETVLFDIYQRLEGSHIVKQVIINRQVYIPDL